MTQLKMFNHHLEQEIIRLQDTIESVAAVNPNQLNFLLEMQPQFNFKNRNIEFSASGHVINNLSTPLIHATAPAARNPNPNPTPNNPTSSSSVKIPPTIAEETKEGTSESPKKPDQSVNIVESEATVPAAAPTQRATSPRKQSPIKRELASPRVMKRSDSRTDDEIETDKDVEQEHAAGEDGHSHLHSHHHKKDGHGKKDVMHEALKGETLTPEDRRLLLRTKWLLQRFKDSFKHEQNHEHTQKSLELLIEVKKNAFDATAAAIAMAESGTLP